MRKSCRTRVVRMKGRNGISSNNSSDIYNKISILRLHRVDRLWLIFTNNKSTVLCCQSQDCTAVQNSPNVHILTYVEDCNGTCRNLNLIKLVKKVIKANVWLKTRRLRFRFSLGDMNYLHLSTQVSNKTPC